MNMGWYCKGCEHFNHVERASLGTHLTLGICEKECGARNIMVPFVERVIE